MRKQTHLAVSVFDAALIRALVNCATGRDYEAAIDDARELASVLEGKPRMRYVADVLTQPFPALGIAPLQPAKKESHVASVAIERLY